MTIHMSDVGTLVTIGAGLCTILGALVFGLRWFIRAEIAPNTHATRQVLHQVQNSHQTNLRDDIDELFVLVRGVNHSLTEHKEDAKAKEAAGWAAERDIRHTLASLAEAVSIAAKSTPPPEDHNGAA